MSATGVAGHKEESMDLPQEEAGASFFAHVRESGFPCLGGKAAVGQGTCEFHLYDGLPAVAPLQALASDLRAFVDRFSEPRSHFAVLAAANSLVALHSEEDFEVYLWDVLQALHRIDERPWDPRYSTDPRDPSYKFSFAGRAFYIVGLSPVASRLARHTNVPVLIFNPVWQFERLRELHQLDALIEKIRGRDESLQGSINPNLRLEGVLSDALQYSGRPVSESWRCPFQFGKAK